MVHDRDTVVCFFPLQHILAKCIKKYEAMNRPCLSRPDCNRLIKGGDIFCPQETRIAGKKVFCRPWEVGHMAVVATEVPL